MTLLLPDRHSAYGAQAHDHPKAHPQEINDVDRTETPLSNTAHHKSLASAHQSRKKPKTAITPSKIGHKDSSGTIETAHGNKQAQARQSHQGRQYRPSRTSQSGCD